MENVESMSDKNRFKKRRAVLRARGLCTRCGVNPAAAGHSKCKKCALEIGIKKMVAPARRLVCEKIGRLERNRALIVEALGAVDLALAELKK